MNLNFRTELKDLSKADFEIVERKGRGHPDTLSDRLAEELSRTYCTLSRKKFGTILRHQFDKLTIMGGKCEVRFGGGSFISPIRLLINGRATPEVGDQSLQFLDALLDKAKAFLETELKNFDFLTNCRPIIEITANTTRGIILDDSAPARSSTYSRFRPGKLEDLPEYTNPLSNDTAVGCGWAPYTPLESMILELERILNADETRKQYPWLGYDIKIMGVRNSGSVSLTLCVPQISTEVSSADKYAENARIVRRLIASITKKYNQHFETKISMNTADGQTDDNFYLLYTGSCAESGDEGQVGRGNRLGGLISSRRPFSMEGLSGKNPQYHGGKLYSVMAWDLANSIWSATGVPCEVFLVSQSDVPINEPWQIIINSVSPIDKSIVQELIDAMLKQSSTYTDKILAGKYIIS
jgi:S-adenosylmethionine synthetase